MINSTCRFVGMLLKPQKDFDLMEINSQKSTWEGLALGFSVKANGNSFRVRVSGGDKRGNRGKFEPRHIVVKSGAEISEEFDVDYNDRFDDEILRKVPNYYKNVVVLNGERHEFIFQTDFVQFIYDNFDELMKQKCLLTGSIDFAHNGKSGKEGRVFQNFTINNIYEAKEEDEEDAKGTLQVFYTQECLSEEVFKNGKLNVPFVTDMNKRIKIGCFVEVRNTHDSSKADYETYHLPIEVMYDGSKGDFAIPEFLKLSTVMLRQFACKDANKVYKSCWDVRLISGKEEVEYTQEEIDELLTEEEKEAIEAMMIACGVDKTNEVIARKQGKTLFSEFKNELRLFCMNSICPVKTEAEEFSKDMLDLYKVIALPSTKDDVDKTSSKKSTKESNEIEDRASKYF